MGPNRSYEVAAGDPDATFRNFIDAMDDDVVTFALVQLTRLPLTTGDFMRIKPGCDEQITLRYF